MAGTPTTNYQFPTYATTDVPDLTGAYNQAVKAIDAKIKEVADTIPSDVNVSDATSTTKGIAKLYDSATIGDGTQDDGGVTPNAVTTKVNAALENFAPKFTVSAPIMYSSDNIAVQTAVPDGDGQNKGVVSVTGGQANIASATDPKSTVVPNVKAVKDYVDAKVPTEQLAYTGTAPIVVDNESRTIRVNIAPGVTQADGVISKSLTFGVVARYNDNAGALDNDSNDLSSALASVVPSLGVMKSYVGLHTPDATTSVKGLVRLTTSPNRSSTVAATPDCVNNALTVITNTWGSLQNAATTPLTTEMLANLYVTPSGIVVYKAPTE